MHGKPNFALNQLVRFCIRVNAVGEEHENQLVNGVAPDHSAGKALMAECGAVGLLGQHAAARVKARCVKTEGASVAPVHVIGGRKQVYRFLRKQRVPVVIPFV